MNHETLLLQSTSVRPDKGGKQVEEVPPQQRYGAKRGVWTENMLIALERGIEGNKWFSLIDKVVSERTLGIAWKKVLANAGACGVDGITVGHFSKDSQNRLLAVREQLKEGRYQPKLIRRAYISKPGSNEQRPLGIPAVADRVVQSALKMVIEPIFEREFSASSYGFRPGRGCKDALREVERLLKQGNCHVVDVDIRGYFDAIPHSVLMRLVKEHVADGKVLGLIEAFLKQGVMEDGVVMNPITGSPQGGIVSPLLANIYLNPLDWLLESLGLHSVRYADDIVVLAADAETAAHALESISEWMEGAGLQLHPEKTRIADMSDSGAYFDFLGYRFKRSMRGKLLRLVRPKSLQKLRETLRRPTKRSNGRSMEAVITLINPVLKGWFGYFKQAHPTVLSGMDGWVRMRLRSILRKRRKRKGRGRGLDHHRWPNRYFENLGLFSLERAREEMISLRKGEKC
jgi:RNA-directed DNA polymerase